MLFILNQIFTYVEDFVLICKIRYRLKISIWFFFLLSFRAALRIKISTRTFQFMLRTKLRWISQQFHCLNLSTLLLYHPVVYSSRILSFEVISEVVISWLHWETFVEEKIFSLKPVFIEHRQCVNLFVLHRMIKKSFLLLILKLVFCFLFIKFYFSFHKLLLSCFAFICISTFATQYLLLIQKLIVITHFHNVLITLHQYVNPHNFLWQIIIASFIGVSCALLQLEW